MDNAMLSSKSFSCMIILTACYSIIYSPAYTIRSNNVYYGDYESLKSEKYSAEGMEVVTSFDVKNRTEKEHLAACRCIDGTCEVENGKEVCKCPPAFAFYDGTSRHVVSGCRPCQCGMDFNCTFAPSHWSGDNKKCLCKDGYVVVERNYKEECQASCSPNPCKNNGICEIVGNKSVCYCPAHHAGRRCEIDLCPDQPCMNGGTCNVTNNTFTCDCKENYSGEKCEFDPCFHNPCRNGGTCTVENFAYKCKCVEPFSGDICEQDLCLSNPCLNGGACKIVGTTFDCSCIEPYSGSTCEKDLCSYEPCKNDGMCKIDGKTFRCYCRDPFYGKTCEDNACSINPCKNGGNCTVDKDSFKCECNEPYSGETCEMDSCSSSPCKNGGICVLNLTSGSNNSSYHCLCKSHFMGITCETVIETTSTVNSTETEASVMTSTQGTTDRIDNIGFSTTDTTRVGSTLHSDGPSTLSTSSADTDRTSRNTPINNITISWPYFRESSTTKQTTLIMETTSTPDSRDSTSSFSVSPVTPSECNCGNRSSSCHFDDQGNQICGCVNGYAQKGKICAGTCSSNEDCLNGGICKGNRRDVNFCECPWDFFGDWCERSDICEKLTPRCSSFGAVCRRTGRTAKCECPPEKTLSWKSGACESICDSQKCQHGKCEIFGNSFICRCDAGYGGFRCDEKLKIEKYEYAELWFYILLTVVVLLLLMGSLYLIRTVKMLQRKTCNELN